MQSEIRIGVASLNDLDIHLVVESFISFFFLKPIFKGTNILKKLRAFLKAKLQQHKNAIIFFSRKNLLMLIKRTILKCHIIFFSLVMYVM